MPDAFLNGHLSESLLEAKVRLEDWCHEYSDECCAVHFATRLRLRSRSCACSNTNNDFHWLWAINY